MFADLKREVLRYNLKVDRSVQSPLYLGEGESRYGDSSGSALEWWTQAVGIRGAEVAGKRVYKKLGGELAGGLVGGGFVGEEQDFEVDVLKNCDQVELLNDRTS